MRIFRNKKSLILPAALLLAPFLAFAGSEGAASGHADFAIVFLFLAVILVASKFGAMVEKVGQPPVLGELVAGIILGNLALLGLDFFNGIKSNQFIAFLSELGVVILLFQIGLESNITEMRKVGLKAFMVAIIGVVAPFVIGTYIIGPYFFAGQSFNTYLFLGATLTATSVGITARVFKDLKKINTEESKIVLGAAVIDDVMGLLILAVVSAIVAMGSVSLGAISVISAKAVIFLVSAIAFGIFMAPHIGKGLSKVHSGIGTKVGFALTFCLSFAYLASVAGLAPIVGAFAAGLVLDPVHFKWFKSHSLISRLKEIVGGSGDEKTNQEITREIDNYQDKHVEELIEDIAHFLVPVFFVYTGMQVDLATFANPRTLMLALLVTAAAFIGKVISGIAAGKTADKWIVGIGMVPRGEVGLIFASVGMGLGVVTPDIYSVIVIMVILSTLLPPPILTWLINRKDRANQLGQTAKA